MKEPCDLLVILDYFVHLDNREVQKVLKKKLLLTFTVIHVKEWNVNDSWSAFFFKNIAGLWAIRIQLCEVHFGEKMVSEVCVLTGHPQCLKMRHHITVVNSIAVLIKSRLTFFVVATCIS